MLGCPAHIELRSWSDFKDTSKYSLPSSVNSLFDRIRTNVCYYAANYMVLAGAVLAIGIFFNFWVFFSLAAIMGVAFASWMGLLKFMPQLKPQSLYILIGITVLAFYIGIKILGSDNAMIVWYYTILSLLPPILHSSFKELNPIKNVANKASNAAKGLRRSMD